MLYEGYTTVCKYEKQREDAHEALRIANLLATYCLLTTYSLLTTY